ncbi:MAG: hypothetical protein ACRDJJ_06790 [Actinomycetota bacterium]
MGIAIVVGLSIGVVVLARRSPSPRGWGRVLQPIAQVASIGGGAGALAGAVAGAGSRLAMRVVAITDGHTSFTMGGSLGLVMGGAVAGGLVGLVLVAIRSALRPRGARLGLLFSVLLLGFPGLPFLFGGGEIEELGIPWVNQLMFGSLFVIYGVLAERAMRALEGRIRRPDPVTATRSP